MHVANFDISSLNYYNFILKRFAEFKKINIYSQITLGEVDDE